MATASKTLTVEEYLGLIQDGTIGEDERVELLNGEIVEKMGKNPPHFVATRLAFAALDRIVPPGWFVTKEDAIRLSRSVPEPDLSVIRGTIRDYSKALPGADAVGLLVEVSDSTLAQDRGLKQSIYARAAIPLYWIINLKVMRIEVFSDPFDGVYRKFQTYGPDDQIPLILDGREVARLAVRDLLP